MRKLKGGVGEEEITGSATETEVASMAQARLTMAKDVNAARSRHPGLKVSTSSSADSVILEAKG